MLGDVDGDNVPDLAVGAPFRTSSGGGVRVGRVEVLSGATGAFVYAFEGVGANLKAGAALGRLGDLDGDGIDELLVGHAGGAATVHSGATGALLRRHDGPGPESDRFGTAVCGVGDIDADGAADYAIGAPSVGTTNPGRVELYSGATGALLRTQFGDSGHDRHGRSLSAVDDIDSDGVPELLIGAPDANHPGLTFGCAWLTSGATGVVIRRFDGVSSNGGSGESVAACGDLDGDGVSEVAIGAPEARLFLPPQTLGVVRVHSGATGAVRFVLSGVEHGDRFGAALAGLANLDGDGLPDLLVGVPSGDLMLPGGNVCASWSGQDDFVVRAENVLSGAPGQRGLD